MPNSAELEIYINTLIGLAGVVFGAGIAVGIGRIGWKIAMRYFLVADTHSKGAGQINQRKFRS